MKSIKGQYRQGDVLMMDIDEKLLAADLGDEVPKDQGKTVLAYGEVTGHSHAISVKSAAHFKAKSSALKTYLRLVEPVSLRHEEHGEIPIKEKTKEISIQRQWTTERIKPVVD